MTQPPLVIFNSSKALGSKPRPHRRTPKQASQPTVGAPSVWRAPEQRSKQQPGQAPPSAPADDELGCRHYASCSGCTLSVGLSRPPVLADAEAYFQQQGLSYQLDCGPAQHWRHRARLVVQRSPSGRPVIGLYKQGTHDAVGIPGCVVHHPAINRAVAAVHAGMEACGIKPYDEATGTGDLRYIQLTVISQAQGEGPPAAAAAAGAAAAVLPAQPQVQLALVWNAEVADDAPAPRRLLRLAEAIWREAGGAGPAQPPPAAKGRDAGQQGQPPHRRQQRRDSGVVHSVWANFQPARTNTILGEQWRLLQGPELAWARLGGADICFGPGSFLQANHDAMDRCLRAMQSWVPASASVVDLHAGVGTIGLSLAATRQPRWVRFVEINPLAEAPFQHSAARLASTLQCSSSSSGSSGSGLYEDTTGPPAAALPRLEFYAAAAGSDPGRWIEGGEIVVVDPPRKGLEPELVQFLAAGPLEAAGQQPTLQRLLYLSCGWGAFKCDCDALLASGRWRMVHAQGFLFFPGSNHIETLAVFDRC